MKKNQSLQSSMAEVIMTNYRLYVVPRTDMASMTPGKSMAQVSHASNQFSILMENNAKAGVMDLTDYDQWMGTKGFGTAIILSANGTPRNQDVLFKEAVERLEKEGIIAGLTVDDSYSVSDGITTHYIPNVITAMFYFATSEQSRLYMPEFDLDRREWK